MAWPRRCPPGSRRAGGTPRGLAGKASASVTQAHRGLWLGSRSAHAFARRLPPPPSAGVHPGPAFDNLPTRGRGAVHQAGRPPAGAPSPAAGPASLVPPELLRWLGQQTLPSHLRQGVVAPPEGVRIVAGCIQRRGRRAECRHVCGRGWARGGGRAARDGGVPTRPGVPVTARSMTGAQPPDRAARMHGKCAPLGSLTVLSVLVGHHDGRLSACMRRSEYDECHDQRGNGATISCGAGTPPLRRLRGP